MEQVKLYRPHRLADPPIIRHYVPASSPAGRRSLGVGGGVGDRLQKRLLPLEGAGCPKGRLRVHEAGAVYRFGLAAARGRRPQSPTPCNYRHHQALRASFLPRWGKKPLVGCLPRQQPSQRLLPKEGAAAERRLRVQVQERYTAATPNKPKQAPGTFAGCLFFYPSYPFFFPSSPLISAAASAAAPASRLM